MATLPILLGIAAVVALPATAFIMANDYHSLEDEGCAIVESEHYAGKDARNIRIRIVNTAEAATLRVCVNEDDGTERHEETVQLAARGEHTILVTVSPATKRVSLEMDRPGYEFTSPVYAIIGAGWTVPSCPDGTLEFVAETEFYGNGSGVLSSRPLCNAG